MPDYRSLYGARFAELMEVLERKGLAPRLLPPDDAEHRAVQAGWEAAFPIAYWGRVDWARVPSHRTIRWDTDDHLARALRELLRPGELRRGEVFVMWSNGRMPMLALPAAVARRHALRLAGVDWDTWLIHPQQGWCLEVYHEGEACFAYAPGWTE